MVNLVSARQSLSKVALEYEENNKENDKANNKGKKIIINFDGTGGEPSWGDQDQSKLPDGTVAPNADGLSNIAKIHLYLGGRFDNCGMFFDDQLSLYYSGVGTRGGGLLASMRGVLNLGTMTDIYNMALGDLKCCYNEGDILYVFGFSRGAATARLFSSYLHRNGFVVDGKQIFPKIKLLGLFESVPASFNRGMSLNTGRFQLDVKYDSWFSLWQSESSLPENVEKAVHMVAVDEQRVQFDVTLLNRDERVTEIWCSGDHSDVGGSWYHDGLSDGTLSYMLNEAKKAGLVYRTITEDTVKNDAVSLIGHNEKLKDVINYDKDMIIEPKATDPNVHNCNTGKFAFVSSIRFFPSRKIRVLKEDEEIDEPVLILDQVIDRIKGFEARDDVKNPHYTSKGYRPPNMKGIKYRIVNSKDGSISEQVYDGIENNIGDAQWD